MAETTKKTRKPRVNFAAERTKLVQYCKISIQVMEAILSNEPPEPNHVQVATSFMRGQVAALKAVLREMGEVVPPKEAHS